MATITITLPDSLAAFVGEKVAAGGHESGGEYLCSLIRDQQAREALRELLLAGAASGAGEAIDDAYFQRRRDHVRAGRTAAE